MLFFNFIFSRFLILSIFALNFARSVPHFSLNNNTPDKHYLGEEYEFSFPKLDNFGQLILKYGANCYLWKRDLSRFFLQLPLTMTRLVAFGEVNSFCLLLMFGELGTRV